MHALLGHRLQVVASDGTSLAVSESSLRPPLGNTPSDSFTDRQDASFVAHASNVRLGIRLGLRWLG